MILLSSRDSNEFYKIIIGNKVSKKQEINSDNMLYVINTLIVLSVKRQFW